MAGNLTVAEEARRLHRPGSKIIARLKNLGIPVDAPDDEVEPDEITALLIGRRPPPRIPVEILDEEVWERLDESLFPTVDANAEPPFVPPLEMPQPQYTGNVAPATLSDADGELLLGLREFLVRNRHGATDEVFVVHGHDDIRHRVANFINELGLRAVMLDARPNRGRTIIEKLEDHANTSFAVVLLTADDEGRKRNTGDYQPRARQNVILELGYFLARLGRHRVCALHSPGVELPSDIHGVLYVELDPAGAWRYPLYSEMM